MSFYRIYPLDSSGRAQAPLEADCASDNEAILRAQGLKGRVKHGCEVWHATRFVGRFHFQPPARPAARVARGAQTPEGAAV